MPVIPHRFAVLAALVLGAALAGAAPATAQVMSAGAYELSPWTIDAGGGASAGGAYDLGGTIGQPDAHSSAAGSYALDGGFWWRLPDATLGVPHAAPLRFAFLPPAPNPSRGSCTLAFELPRECRARVEVFAIDGRRVAVPLDRVAGAGRLSVAWQGRTDDGRALPAGVYLVRVQAGADRAVRRIVLLDR